MKLQITIKQQAEAINGRAKYSLYRSAGEKNYDQDYGKQTLQELIQNSSIKIYCNQCLKQITTDTIVITYEHQSTTQQLQQPNVQSIINLKESDNKLNTNIIPVHSQVNQMNSTPHPNHYLQSYNLNQPHLNQYHKNPSQSHPKQDIINFTINSTQKQDQKKQPHSPTHLYCVGCFANLQDFPPYYSIRKSLKTAPIDSQWTIFDQICLLNGLKFWGFGNWGQIKQFMDYNACPFTLKQIQSHYQQLYIKANGPFQSLNNQHQELNQIQMHKPLKKSIQKIMHHYYYPPQSQQKLHPYSLSNLQNTLKRERPVQSIDEQKKIDFVKTCSQKALPSKQPKSHKNITTPISLSSHTSLKNVLDKQHPQLIQQHFQTKQLKQQQSENDSNQGQDSSDQEQQQQDKNNQISLKPKSSSILPSLKVHHSANKTTNDNPMIQSGLIKPESTQKLQQSKQQNGQSITVHPKFSNLKGHNVYSYNPKRKQFQIIEYDCYAESMIAQLEFSQNDTEQEQMLKIKIIEEYNRRLDQRIKRREFVIQHRLLDTQFMIKTLQKYKKNNVQKFEPFRRLIAKNQDYFQIVQTYDTLCKMKGLTEGLIKVKRKLKREMKNPRFRDVVEYLGKKKQKKQLLGQKAKFDKQPQRRVLSKQMGRVSKRVILSMCQNSSTYLNQLNMSQSVSVSVNNGCLGVRTMTSRSQERERLRSLNQNVKGESGQKRMDEMNLGNESKLVNELMMNKTSLGGVISEDEMGLIQEMVGRELSRGGNNGDVNKIDIKPLILRNFVVKPLSSCIKEDSQR